jgi:hypothetical protein
LTLLGLNGSQAVEAVGAVKHAMSLSRDLETELTKFLDDSNWRPHLVAAVAVTFAIPSESLLARIWAAFDGGSWVSPQLAAALSVCDERFREKALDRLKRGCAVVNPPTYESSLHKHSAAGPAGSYERAGKAASALAALLKTNATPQELDVINSSNVQQIVAADIDTGGGIALNWLEKLKSLRACIENGKTVNHK